MRNFRNENTMKRIKTLSNRRKAEIENKHSPLIRELRLPILPEKRVGSE